MTHETLQQTQQSNVTVKHIFAYNPISREVGTFFLNNLFNWQKYKEKISKVFTDQRECIL